MKLSAIEKIALKMRDALTKDIIDTIENITDLEQTDRDGRTLLINATFYGREDVVQYLLLRNANINAQDRNGFTALHAAVQEKNYKIIELLLNYGADVNIQNKFGNTPIWTINHDDPKEILELLLKNGADPKIKNHYGVSFMDSMEAYPKMLVLLKKWIKQ